MASIHTRRSAPVPAYVMVRALSDASLLLHTYLQQTSTLSPRNARAVPLMIMFPPSLVQFAYRRPPLALPLRHSPRTLPAARKGPERMTAFARFRSPSLQRRTCECRTIVYSLQSCCMYIAWLAWRVYAAETALGELAPPTTSSSGSNLAWSA